MSPQQSSRLPQGGLIDRSRPLAFTFNGRAFEGFLGDTLASALVANGVRLVGRSFKYHRPRGLLAAGPEEPNALVEIGSGPVRDTNVRATEVLLSDGLAARSVNCWPSVAFDIGGLNNIASRFLSAGFYYKTFMWPTWHLYEWAIRRAAGIGEAPASADPDRYETQYEHCDVLVVGGGAAGLAAARAAASGGTRVMLVEQDGLLGGRLLWDPAEIDGLDGPDWAEKVGTDLEALPNVRVLTRTTALGYFDHNFLAFVEQLEPGSHGPRQRLWQVRARKVILATGAIERPLVFAGNDRPGVMLASAVRKYVNRYAALPGHRAVVYTNNDDAYQTAFALADKGIEVQALVDTRTVPAAHLVQRLRALGIPLYAGARIVGTSGRRGLKRILLRENGGSSRHVRADLLATSGGFNPTVHLFCQSGGSLQYDKQFATFKPLASVQNEASIGAAKGDFSLSSSLAEAHAAGIVAARESDYPAAKTRPPAVSGSLSTPFSIEPCWGVEGAGKAFVDFQNDVTTDDIALAVRENYASVEHLKRYTTLGMAPDQGKTSNVNGLAFLAQLTGREIQDVGVTRYRFPFTPVSFGALSGSSRGDLFRPIRRMPAHAEHEKLGAVFEDYGAWRRPAYYLRDHEDKFMAEQREALTVRRKVGLFEGSPLGKIEILGPDAAKFLDLIYANTMSTLKVGKARYGLMLNELGVIIDDGVTMRLGEDHFWVGTTGAGADRIAGWMEEWLQCEWLDLKVIVAPVSQAWGVVTLTGPKAWDVLAAAGADFPLSSVEFPHMSFRAGSIAGIPARVARVSYTGEVSFEINVPSGRTAELWRHLLSWGEPFGIAPVGIDAWTLLRTEKGYIHVGADTDGSTAPDDIGWGHIMKKKSDFIGRRSLTRPANLDQSRLQFVGLRALDVDVLPVGAHLGMGSSRRSEGYITSAGHSPVLGQGVALGMIKAGRSRMGEVLTLLTGPTSGRAEIVPACFYDPAGDRLNA